MLDRKKLDYKAGDTTDSGYEIAFIYGQTSDVGVYRDSSYRVHFETVDDQFTEAQAAANAKYDEIAARIRECLPSMKRNSALDALALALFRGMTADSPESAVLQFTTPSELVAHEALVQARFQYVLFGSIAAAIAVAACVILILTIENQDVLFISIGALGGSVGAWTSLLQRTSTLEIGPFETAVQHRFQGLTRILLGLGFGLLVVAASRANLLLGAAYESEWAVAVMAYIAGFSERFIPEMIRQFESGKKA